MLAAHTPPLKNGGRAPPGGHQTLVEAELASSVAWLIRLRWIAGAGVLLATWALGAVFQLRAPAGALYAIGAGILLYNLVFHLTERRLSRAQASVSAFTRLALAQAGVDWGAMTLLMHFSGGVESPAIPFFLFHIILGSIFFSPRTAFAFALLASSLLSGTALLEFAGWLPHAPIDGFLESPLYHNGLYVAAVLLFFASTSLIAAYLASSIHRRLRRREAEIVSLTHDLRRASARLAALNDGARAVGSTLELPEVLNRLAQSTAEAMGVRGCSIRLLDPGGERLETVARYGLSPAYEDKGPLEVSANPLAREVLAGKTVHTPDVWNDSLVQYPQAAREEGVRSMLSAPLIGKDGPLGILRAYAAEPQRFTPDDEDFLTAIAAQGSLAIENALTYRAVEALDAAKSQFVRMVTHELRSPVSVTRSLLRTVLDGYAGPVTTQQQDAIQRAIRRVDFLQKLVDDLLDLAAGKSDAHAREKKEPVALRPALERVVRRFETPAHEKRLSLEFQDEMGGPSPKVAGTAESLDRVFNNLVSNAVKYTRPGGRVRVSLRQSGAEVLVEVADTGIGIPEAAMPHLFEEFYRAPNAREVEREGTGLGLTIVKDILAHLGGKIAVHNPDGGGTRFTVTLPAADQPGAAGGKP